ncbi:PilZ domain-containing protein [Acidovorax sp. GBBC 3332]|nr:MULTISPECIES: adenylate/guanylate cyclase domain-containing protein [unclassified Acidovorax]MDA8462438.1 PilZ domain-containing protein [Acidovorax sp. GBBC 3333]MDA8467472.1 PilZ domain-containing protein [Acidovorax sp. GBBC 3332]MDA8472513.1 PilZ domain-containing protein [Acidovorax sp. GBBC 3299]WCM77367.1 PilZ domain-containing protein [Acidovorax sp. GBBC 712]
MPVPPPPGPDAPSAPGAPVSAVTGTPFLQEREVTLLKAGIRDFAQVASSMPPAQARDWMERVIGCLYGLLPAYGGVLAHWTGEGAAVLFPPEEGKQEGDGKGDEGGVQRAAMYAVALQMALKDLNDAFRQDRLPPVYVGVGIAFGPALVGDLAPSGGGRQAPVLLGTVVSEASQLRAFALRGQVLVNEAVYQRCWTMASVSAPTHVFVKGRSEPLPLRELVAVPGRRLKVPRQEFRRSLRVEANLPCSCQLVQDGAVLPHLVPCSVRDMGYHGALLELGEPVPLHGELRLAFDLPIARYQARDVYARVVTLNTTGPQVLAGVEFTATSAEFDAQVRRFVQGMVVSG